MGDSTLSQSTFAYSSAKEVGVNTVPQTASLYTTYETLARILPIPNAEKQADEPRIGAGAASAYPTFQRSRVLQPIALDISDIVNTAKLPKLLQRHMGAADVVGAAVETTIIYPHTLIKQNFDSLGRQLPSSTFIMKNNGAYFAYGGCVSNSLQIQQNGIDDPKFTQGFVGTGYYEDVSLISGFGSLSVPTRDPLQDMLGAETGISYVNASSVTKSLQGRWKSFAFTSNNNIDTGDLRAGLTRVASAVCPTRGWYRSFLNANDETVSMTYRVAHDATMAEWNSAQTDEILTSFDVLMKGSCVPTSAANNQYSVKVSIGTCYFRNVRGGDDNNLAVLDIDVFPVRNGSYFGVQKIVCNTGSNTALA